MSWLARAFLILLLSCPARAELLSLAADPWAPYVDTALPHSGLACGIVRTALERAGYETRFTVAEWAFVLEEARAGRFDALVDAWPSKEREADFVFSEPYLQNEIVLVKNPDYWQPGLPKLDRVVYRAIPDSTTRLQALLKNEFDFITHPDPKDMGEVRKNANVVVKSTPGWAWDYQQFNLKKPNMPYQNKLVRQALARELGETV